MKKRTFFYDFRLIGTVLGLGLALTARASHFDGSRTTPVHRIPLTDQAGEHIVPGVAESMPISTRMTCGACHDYDEIHQGTHFTGVEGRPAQPWIKVDEKTGTQIPADRLDLTPWEFTKAFGTHLPGGGVSDPDDKLADMYARWDISGGLEINCFACHNHSHRQDMTEWARQIGRENFRWAATAASGIGEVNGMASRMPEWWTLYDGKLPDDKVYRLPPSVNYDASMFDSKDRAWLDLGKPKDKNCLQCHSNHPVTAQRMDIPGDVHSTAGLSCTDCHRNGEDHKILRGTTEAMSCAACHTGDGQTAGRAGAPIARHKGIPPVHFEEMTCTACHSGIRPGAEPTRIRTSRANRLGIYGRAQWYTESPFIVEPVFIRNDEGKIEPRRMMWPAFWSDVNGNPLAEETVAEAAVGVLDTAEQIALVLGSFAGAEGALGEPVFAENGKAYIRNIDGGLDLLGKTDLKARWLWKTETNLVSTIPEFDVLAEELDYDIEGLIIGVMDAFKPLDVVMVSKGRRFDLGDDGYVHGADTDLTDGWYTKNGGSLVSDFAVRAVADTVGTVKVFNEEQVAEMLKKLGNDAAYISAGRMFKLEGDTLVNVDHEAAEPVSWAVGHDVRGAGAALGAQGCQDCHDPESDFLFGTVTATGPLMTDNAAVTPMYAFQELNSGFNKMFGMTFKVRKGFKCSLSMLATLLTLIGLAVGLPLIYKLAKTLEEKEVDTSVIRKALMGVMLILALTGFIFGWPFASPLGGFPLLVHVGFGTLYAALLVIWTLLRSKAAGHIWYWVLLISGIVLILSILIAMFPILGTHGQHKAMIVHRFAAVLSIVAALLACTKSKKTGG